MTEPLDDLAQNDEDTTKMALRILVVGMILLTISIVVFAQSVLGAAVIIGSNADSTKNHVIGYHPTVDTLMAQSFTIPAVSSGTINNMTIQLGRSTPQADTWVAIMNDNATGGVPCIQAGDTCGKTVYSNTTMAATTITAAGNYTFNFTNGTVSPGTTYWIVFSKNVDATSGTQLFENNPTTSYANGTAKSFRKDTSAWSALGDMTFAIGWSEASSPSASLNVTLNSPADLYHSANGTSAAPLLLAYNLTMHNFGSNTTTCDLQMNGALANRTTGIATNATLLFANASIADGAYNWSVNCSGWNFQANQTTANRTIIVDRTNPTANLETYSGLDVANTTILRRASNTSTLRMAWNLSDTWLWGHNLTVVAASNGTQYYNNYTTNYTVASFILDKNVSTSGWATGTYNVTLSVEDDHTAKTIPAYAYSFSPSGVTYITEYGTVVTVENEQGNLKSINTTKEADRYTFTFEPNNNRKTWSFLVTSSQPLADRTSLWGYPGFVISAPNGGNWLDFHIADDTMNYTVERVSSLQARITVTRGKEGKEPLTFRSLGGLNIITQTYSFNISDVPPQVNNLAGAAGITTINLTYTLPGYALTSLYNAGTTNTSFYTFSTSSRLYLAGNFTTAANATSLNVTVQLRTYNLSLSQNVTASVWNSNGTHPISKTCDADNAYNTSALLLNMTPYTVPFTFTTCTLNSSTEYWLALNTSVVSTSLAWDTIASCGNCLGTGTSAPVWSLGNEAPLFNVSTYTSALANSGSSLYHSNGTLIYNGTNTTVTTTVTGLTQSTAYAFYALTWWNNTNIFNYNTTQTVGMNYLSLTTLNNGSASVYVKNEVDKSLITSNVTVTFIGVNNVSSSTTSGQVDISNLTAGNYTVRASGIGWGLRDRFLTINTSTTNNYTLYLLNDTFASNGLAEVRDSQGGLLEGAIVKLLRYYGDTNSYETVQEAQTIETGSATMVAQAYSAYYKWIIQYDGVTEYTSTTPEALTLDSTALWHKYFVINIGNDFYDAYRTLTGAYYSVSFNNVTGALTMIWNDPSGLVTYGCLKDTYANATRYETISNCGSGSSGSVVLNIPDWTTKTHTWVASLNDSTPYRSQVVQTGSIKQALYEFGKGLGFMVGLLFVVGGSLLFSFSAISVVLWNVFVVAVFSMTTVFAAFPFSLVFVFGLAALGIGVAVFLMRR